MKRRNEQFAKTAAQGKKPTKLSRREQLEKKSPIPLWALGIVLFVVVGGGTLAISF
jgi:hypothetical protein